MLNTEEKVTRQNRSGNFESSDFSRFEGSEAPVFPVWSGDAYRPLRPL
jgi:hypothetical protein